MPTAADQNTERRAAIAQACAELNKVLQALRTYQEGHPTLDRFRKALRDRLTEVLEADPRLELDLTPLTIEWNGEPVLSAERKDQSITHQLFLEGVQKLTFQQGLQESEIDELVRLWHKAISGKLVEDESFTTGFWECDLENVSCLNVDELAIFYGVANDDERMQSMTRVMDEIRVGPQDGGPATQVATPDALARLAGVDPKGIVEIDDATLSKKDTDNESGYLRVKGKEREQALAAVMEPPHKIAARAVRAMAGAREQGSERDRAKLDEHLASACAKYTEAGYLREAVTMLEEARRAGPAIHAVASRAIADEKVLLALVPRLDEDASRDLAFALLKNAGSSAHRALLVALATLKNETALSEVVKELTRDLPGPADIAWSVERYDSAYFARVMEIARTPQQKRAAERAALSHKDAAVRRDAFKSLDKRGIHEHRALLLSLLDDADPRVARSVLMTLVSFREEAAIPAIEKRLSKNLSDEDRRTLYTALGSIGGAAASAVLVRAFDDTADPALKAPIALAIGRAGDPGARSTLEAHVKKIFTSPKVKEACREALRRLDEPRIPEPEEEDLDPTEGEVAVDIEDDEPEDDEEEEEPGPGEIIEPDPELEATTLDGVDEDTADEDTEDPDTDPGRGRKAAAPAPKSASYDHLHSEAPDLDWAGTFRTTVVVKTARGYVFGSRYEQRLTDAHYYETPSLQVAYRSFLGDKVRTGFLPQLDSTRTIQPSDAVQPFDLALLLSFWGNPGETVPPSEMPVEEDRTADAALWLAPPEGPASVDKNTVMGLPSPREPVADATPSIDPEEQVAIETEYSRLAGTGQSTDPVARVLVVDDRDFNRDLLARILKRGGHQVFTADGGALGLERLAEGGIDLVCLDVNMPVMDGYEVAQVIRRQYSRVQLPIIFFTARDAPEDILKGLKVGANDYLTKPVDSAEALARVRTQLLITLALRHTKAEPKPLEQAVVLIVDGVVKNRKLYAAWLEQMGHVPVEAENGEKALQLINEEAMDLVLVDLQAPGMPGQELISILRRYFSMVDLPIVALAPPEEPRIASKALLAGANDVVARPLAMDIATERVRWQLDVKSLFEELRAQGETPPPTAR
jgi:CheY-like chemotaxis protein